MNEGEMNEFQGKNDLKWQNSFDIYNVGVKSTVLYTIDPIESWRNG